MVYNSLIPLVVDLDGTLIEEDMLIECIRYQVSSNPLSAAAGLASALFGKGAMKEKLARGFVFSPENLSYRNEVLHLIKEARSNGVEVFLATGSVKSIAEPIASHLALFSGVLSSDRELNNTGRKKAQRLTAIFGERGFDYVGNALPDLEVWCSARHSYLAGTDPRVARAFWALSNAIPIEKGGF
jgi:phosphoserine phosphatase